MKYFGTDGIRGTYGDAHINEEFFSAVGFALAQIVAESGGKKIVAGGDTRASTDTLKAAFLDGFVRGGGIAEDLGVLPTPALAYGVLSKGAEFGAMVTASHNPYSDNGIKFFDRCARKIDDTTQLKIEEITDNIFSREDLRAKLCKKKDPSELSPREIRAGKFALENYAKKMSSIFPKNFLSGMRIALDTANGATSGVSSKVLRGYGAEVFCTGDNPNGFNINDSVGSQHPESLAALCRKTCAQVGFAHDGDGDRVVVCDENSEPVDGEIIMGLIAFDAEARKHLESGAIVTTIQSNTGLDSSLKARGIKVFRSGIGDRLVMAEMLARGCNIGGESSGHFIFSEVSPCGDGLAAALAVLSALSSSGKKISDIKAQIKLNPLIQNAIKVQRKIPIEKTDTLSKAVAKCSEILGESGRTLVRYSGTENKIRLLVESPFPDKNSECMQLLVRAVEKDLK